MNNTINNLFISAIGAKGPKHTITVQFKGNHAPAVFSFDMLNLLLTDPAVEIITDNETGEILN